MNKFRSMIGYLVLATGLLFFVVCRGDSDSTEDKGMAVVQAEHKHSNHLVGENSPYLLSHAHNPVDWYPWGKEALDKARTEDKPIFLSIGYAACHWCHVMERESFENELIAAILNENFVSIKVDREQRPDLDNIYMSFTQAMTGGGGWPMSIFLTPDLKPFYAGTYFPPEDRYGRPGFKRLITEIAQAYASEKEKIVSSANDISRRLAAGAPQSAGQSLLVVDMIAQGAARLMSNVDHANGGFGRTPKFPHATELSLFLRHYRASGDISYLKAADKALTAMARGGIYDHVGGGFARYATDEKWLVPHFEKMLYDNGLLVPVYADAFQITSDSSYLEVVRGTLDFVLREMTDPAGGFYSALDADSDGEEGKFYVWSKAEIEEILGKEADLFCRYYNVTGGGNFEGHNILNITSSSHRLRPTDNPAEFDRRMASNRQKLLEARSQRVRPLTDDKILVSWNGLALRALCAGYRLTGDERYLNAAIKNADFVRTELFRDNRLTHSYREGRHSDGQFLEDYGYYLGGLLELYQVDHSANNGRWLEFAVRLADNAVDLFLDNEGTLYMREGGQADLLFRPREDTDNARPSPGSYLISSLLKLGRLTEREKYTAAGEMALRALSGTIARQPGSMASALLALDYHLQDKIEIVIVGNGSERSRMLDEFRGRFLPNALLAVSESGDDDWPLFEGRKADDGEAVAFVCRNSACRMPVVTAKDLARELDGLSK